MARSRPTSRSSARADPDLVRDRADDRRWHVVRGRRRPPAVHDPVDLQAADLRPRPRGPRRGRGPARIGVEPTGEAFNTITLAPGTGAPLNPMVNSRRDRRGVAGPATSDGRRARADRRALRRVRRSAARRSTATYSTPSGTTGHRNRAIAHLLRASGAIDGDADEALDRYFAPVLGEPRRAATWRSWRPPWPTAASTR